MNTTNLMSPATVLTATPRGARWAAAIAARLLHMIDRLTAPRPAPRRNHGDEAAALRAYATRVARHDPRFAADLFAAADRHELLVM